MDDEELMNDLAMLEAEAAAAQAIARQIDRWSLRVVSTGGLAGFAWMVWRTAQAVLQAGAA